MMKSIKKDNKKKKKLVALSRSKDDDDNNNDDNNNDTNNNNNNVKKSKNKSIKNKRNNDKNTEITISNSNRCGICCTSLFLGFMMANIMLFLYNMKTNTKLNNNNNNNNNNDIINEINYNGNIKNTDNNLRGYNTNDNSNINVNYDINHENYRKRNIKKNINNNNNNNNNSTMEEEISLKTTDLHNSFHNNNNNKSIYMILIEMLEYIFDFQPFRIIIDYFYKPNILLKDTTSETCQIAYGKKNFRKGSDKRLPPMLYTFPGSGNTWTRLLIEYGTGIYTGSVYNDKTLREPLPGEFTCDYTVSVIKVHPHTHSIEPLLGNGRFNSDQNKCLKGGIKKFERAILLIRNPFDSIWSEYQRRLTQSHVDGIHRNGFDWSRWQANAATMSHLYFEMFNRHYATIYNTFSSSNILLVRYEDLYNTTTRIETLAKVIRFLKVRPPKDRLECSFILSKSKKAYRNVDTNKYMTKDLAYVKNISCRMWSLFGSYAEKYGYTSWNNENCTGYEPIPKLRVGPQGEYNKKWLKKGQKEINYAGLNLKEKKTYKKRKGNEQEIATYALKSYNKIMENGLTLDKAHNIPGVSNVGQDKAIWV